MKKNLFFLAVAAAALASCSNDQVVSENTTTNQPKEIAFSPIAQKATRAAGAAEYNAVEGTAFPQNYDMKVVAYSYVDGSNKGNYFGSATADAAPLFKYNYAGGSTEGTNTYWGGVPAQYWPLSPATLNFLAVTNNGSPTADVVSETFASDYASQVTVTLSNNNPQAASTGTGQHDLMYAYGQASVTKSSNVLTIPSKVDMTFNHALAWVYFRVKAGNAAAEAISIKDIKLKGANYAGTFQAKVNNYNTASSLTWDDGNTKWTAASSSSDNYSPNFSSSYDKKGATGAAANDSKQLQDDSFFGVGDGILVVPTSEITPATNSIASFDIEYYLNGNLYTYNYVPTDLVFAKGKKYVYDITMTLSEIFVDASVTDWDVVTTEYVNIPTMAYGSNYTVDASAEAQTLVFNIAGLSSASNKYKVIVGGTNSGQVDSTVPTADTATALSSTNATVKVNMKASGGSAKTFTITIQERDSSDANDVGTATVIIVNQAAS